MAIREVTMFEAVCDGCGSGDESWWVDADSAIESALNGSDWDRDTNDRLLCWDCRRKRDEEEEATP